jgi:hypothetical protein
MELTDDQTLAVLVSQVGDLRGDFKLLADQITARDQQFVTRGEFEAWRIGMDREMKDAKSEIKANKDESTRAKAPWWAVGSLIVAAIAVALAVVQALVQG